MLYFLSYLIIVIDRIESCYCTESCVTTVCCSHRSSEFHNEKYRRSRNICFYASCILADAVSNTSFHGSAQQTQKFENNNLAGKWKHTARCAERKLYALLLVLQSFRDPKKYIKPYFMHQNPPLLSDVDLITNEFRNSFTVRVRYESPIVFAVCTFCFRAVSKFFWDKVYLRGQYGTFA